MGQIRRSLKASDLTYLKFRVQILLCPGRLLVAEDENSVKTHSMSVMRGCIAISTALWRNLSEIQAKNRMLKD
ncbi:hypothetical protein LshimejAT787_0407770 [Lyophyllum shimeji]|uniref:Uncharacterized protein n=1 Tax=Lyophyllum shimeji TaxID=47721 RepID=A0A9P3PLX7_LYOSH|nr:hypothetical protein LshimejAT787_0407770 [Lyophyllum shimeji]